MGELTIITLFIAVELDFKLTRWLRLLTRVAMFILAVSWIWEWIGELHV